jgi:hypothetical protein
MKKISIFLILAVSILSCKEEVDTPLEDAPNYTVEGKWLYDLDTAGISNTMYIFEDGKRYTYYCTSGDCDSLYNTFEAGDTNALPGTNDYTFVNDTLTIDLNFGNIQKLPVKFECDGGRINFQDPTSPDRYDWVRLENPECY